MSRPSSGSAVGIPAPELPPVTGVRVRTPARLHFTLIDMNGEIGRLDGSLGLAIAPPRCQIEVRQGPRTRAIGVTAATAAEIEREAQRCAELLGVSPNVEIEVVEQIPRHQGLGSGTQLHLAILTALARLRGRQLAATDLVALSHRGGTSGTGTHAFLEGGFLLDGGHDASQAKSDFLPSRFCPSVATPPLLLRRPFPSRWRIVLFVPSGLGGLAGEAERRFMADNTPLPRSEVEQVCHVILMKLLPALGEEDIETFGAAIDDLQRVGWKSRHWRRPRLAPLREVAKRFRAAGLAGCGLSSTGATLFGFSPDRERAEASLAVLQSPDRGTALPPGSLLVAAGDNDGAVIEPL